MIELLKQRGEGIAEQEFDEVHRIERLINKSIREHYDELTTPNVAFITFEEEEAVKIARINNKKRTSVLLGSPMHFEEPLSPTDIIWENR